MKKTLTTLLLCLFAIMGNAQNDVTKFLGIPVDGTYSDMKRRLMAKGFKAMSALEDEYFEGKFNGEDVIITMLTNNNKVWRIFVRSKNLDGSAKNIRRKFNRLVLQFEQNDRYVKRDVDQTIDGDVDIEYEVRVNKKEFEASFNQKPDYSITDSIAIKKSFRDDYLKICQENNNDCNEEEIENLAFLSWKLRENLISLNKTVWFRIAEYHGEYFIAMYYDNEYNRANGEDL